MSWPSVLRPAGIVALLALTLAPATLLAQPSDFVRVTDSTLQNPAPGDWPMWRRTLNGWGYSPLDQVNRENVDTLRMVWSRALTTGTQEVTPLAYNGVLYVPQTEDVIHAIDAVTGDLKWEYRRDLPDGIYDFVGGNGRNNRNMAIYDNLIINTSADDYVFALDAETGKLAWETQVLDYQVNPATQSAGPIIANGKVISGRACYQSGARQRAGFTETGFSSNRRPLGGPDACVITAHDAKTGKELWRRRTIPAPGEPGDETWGGVPYEERKHVGTWMVPSFDPELNLVYIGTSVTSPAPKFLLAGPDQKYLYHNCTLALDADTGEIRWYYQHLNDHWDLDHPFERLLVDTAVAPNPSAVSWINPRIQPGEVRKVVTGIPGKTGVIYTLDRETGEFLWATPTITQNVINHIDGATGEVTENPEVIFSTMGQQLLVCPSLFGGKDTEAGAYSPLTNAMYYPLANSCARLLASVSDDASHPHYALAVRHQLAPGTDQLGSVHAVSAETGERKWLYEQRGATLSLATTGGGLVFGGDVSGRFRAFDQETGAILWEVPLGSPVVGYPISYAVDGRQYVAVSTGPGALNLRVTPEIRPSFGSNLFVFALPDRN